MPILYLAIKAIMYVLIFFHSNYYYCKTETVVMTEDDVLLYVCLRNVTRKEGAILI